MALVTSLEPKEKQRSTVHRPTRCQYSVVEDRSGQRYLQLDTLGSDERQVTHTVSQIIQFDRQAAEQLVQLLRQTFPDLK